MITKHNHPVKLKITNRERQNKMNFTESGISENLVKTLSTMGIKEPTPIQRLCLPHALAGRDIIAQAKTGTGKTLAFLLPIFERLNTADPRTQALIVTPTRELAIQITDVANMLSRNSKVSVVSAYGGRDTAKQINKLKGSAQIIVATPGRLLDHLGRNTADLSKLRTLVIDEADQMMLMGFKKEVGHIIRQTPKTRQTLCFSATMDDDVKELCALYMTDPKIIEVSSDTVTIESIRQQVVETTDRHKQEALFDILNQDNPFMAIIFCRTKVRVDKLEESMHAKGYNCAKLHSDIQQSKREKIMKAFRKGDIQYLIATDVASRGLDISGIDNIYNYDIPENAHTYIHRTGRTGRAGQDGYTCMLVTPKDIQLLKEIEEAIGFKIERRA